MIGLFTPAQVRAMDQRACSRGVTSLALMERAAGHLARTVVRVAGRGYGLRVTLLCGKGNNGGDGLAAARRLRDAGARPTVCLAVAPEKLSGDAAVQFARYRSAAGRLSPDPSAALADADLAVDCLLGTGASGPPRAPYRPGILALRSAAERGVPVIACDLPSGVDADSGAVPDPQFAVRADVTVTLGAHKRGLWLWPARGYCGRLLLGELGIVADDRPSALALTPDDAATLLPPPPAHVDKRGRGVVVALAGSEGMTGAAVLVAQGALAGGAGLVTVATPASSAGLICAVPEALTLALPAEPDLAFDRLAARLAGADVLVVGPGLGHDPATVALVRRVVHTVAVPLVLDADGVNAFRHCDDLLADHRTPLLVLTPHRREFERLFPPGPGVAEVWARRIETAAAGARKWNAVVVAKGPGTLVAAPDGADGDGCTWINPTGSVALATGGSGDVLAGLLAAVIARGASAARVAAAVYVHGLAGQLAGNRIGWRSVTARAVVAALPDAFRQLEETVS